MKTDKKQEDAPDPANHYRVSTSIPDKKALIDAIIASVSGVFYAFNQAGKFVLWNNSMAKFFGLSDEQMPETDAVSGIHPDDRSFIESKIQEAFTIGHSEAEARVVSGAGEVRHFFLTATRFSLAGTDLLVGIGIDITAHKQAEAKLHQAHAGLQQFIDANIIGFVISGMDGVILDANDYYLNLVGYTREELEQGKVNWRTFTPREWLTADEQAIRELKERGACTPYEKGYVLRDGRRVWILLAHMVLTGTNGQLAAYVLDITDRMRAEEQVKNSEKTFRSMTDTSPLAIYLSTGIEEKGEYINPSFTGLFGYTLDDIPSVSHWWPLAYPDPVYRAQVRAEWERKVEQAIKTSSAIEPIETVVTCKDGSQRNILWGYISTGVKNWSYGLDLTERKQAEDKIRESEKKFRSMTDTSPLAIYMSSGIDLKGEYMNPTFTRLFGYTLDDIPSALQWWPLAYPDAAYRAQVRAEWEGKVEQAMKRRSAIEPMETIVTCKDGSKKHISWGFISTGIQDWSFGLDLTDRKQAEEALRRSEEHLRLSQMYGGIGTWEEDLRTKEEFWSEGIVSMLGFPALEKPTWDDYLAIILPEDRQSVVDAIQAHLDRGVKLDVEYRIQANDGQVRWVRSAGQAERDADGMPLRIRGIGQDITDRKRAEEALHLVNKRFRRFVESNIVGIVTASPDGSVLDANDYYLNLVGFSRQEMEQGKVNWKDITPPEYRSADEKALRELREQGVCAPYEKEYSRRDGSRVPVFLTGTMLPSPGEQIAAFFLDITERKRSEQDLQRLVQTLQQRDWEITRVNALNDALQSCHSIEEAHQLIALSIGDIFTGIGGGLAIPHASGQFLETVVQWGAGVRMQPVFTADDCWALRSGHPYVIGYPQNGLPCRHFESVPQGGYLCLPLVVQGQVQGLLHLASSEGALSPHIQGLAASFGETLKLSLANIKLRAALQEQAVRDALTGLFNRRFMDEALSRELCRAVRTQSPLCVALLDIDHFKNFNDTFGHAIGDEVLKAIGSVLSQNLRRSDVACRFGGEELVLILPDSTLEDASRRLEQIRDRVRQMDLSLSGRSLPQVTLSAGLAQASLDESITADDLLEQADTALYVAKQAGRDRIEVFQRRI